MKRILSAWAAALTLLPLALASTHAERTHHRAGTSSAPFLKIGAGARPVGMGESVTAAADDAYALYWNPAGITRLDRPVFAVTHQEAYQGLSHEFFGYAQPLMLRRDGLWRRAPHRMAFGASLQILTVPGDLERRSEETTDAMAQTTSAQGTFGAADMAFGASFALALGERHRQSFGATAKLVRQSIDDETAHGGALDLGWVGRDIFIRDLSLAAALLNLGPGIRFSQNWYPMPLTLKAGAGYFVERVRTRLSADVSVPRDDFPWFAFGGEVGVKDYLFFRAGYRCRWHGNPLGAFSGFRTGIGFAYKSLSVDYAMAPFGELGISHRFSVGLKFGQPRPEPQAGSPTAAPAPAAEPIAVLQLEPAPVPLEAKGLTEYRVTAAPRSISARGNDFLVEAVSPDEATRVPKIAFRAFMPSGSSPAVSVGPAASHPPLPAPFEPLVVRVLRVGVANARSVYISVALGGEVRPEGFAVLGLFGGQWKELPSEAVELDGKQALRASSDRLPEAVALASSGQ